MVGVGMRRDDDINGPVVKRHRLGKRRKHALPGAAVYEYLIPRWGFYKNRIPLSHIKKRDGKHPAVLARHDRLPNKKIRREKRGKNVKFQIFLKIFHAVLAQCSTFLPVRVFS